MEEFDSFGQTQSGFEKFLTGVINVGQQIVDVAGDVIQTATGVGEVLATGGGGGTGGQDVPNPPTTIVNDQSKFLVLIGFGVLIYFLTK